MFVIVKGLPIDVPDIKMKRARLNKTKDSGRKSTSSRLSHNRKVHFIPEFHINDLPVEIRLKILSYFSIKELTTVISHVCKEWYTLAYDPMFRQELSFDNLRFNAVHSTRRFSAFQPQITRSNQLRSLTINECCGVSAIFREVSKNCPFVKTVRVINCKYLTDKDLECLVSCCPNVERVVVHDCELTYFMPLTYNILAGFKYLKALSLKGIIFSGSLSMSVFADMCVSLVEVGVEMADIMEDDLCYFLEKKKNILQTLLIACNNLTEKSWKMLQTCESLTTIGLSSLSGQDGQLLKYLVTLKNLIHLRLDFGFEVEVEWMVHLFTEKKGNKFVTVELNSCVQVDDEVVSSICNHGSTMKHLRLIHAPKLSDEGIKALCERCVALNTLTLRFCRGLTPASLKYIPENLPNLKKFCVTNYHFDARALSEVVACMPNVKFVFQEEESLINI